MLSATKHLGPGVRSFASLRMTNEGQDGTLAELGFILIVTGMMVYVVHTRQG